MMSPPLPARMKFAAACPSPRRSVRGRASTASLCRFRDARLPPASCAYGRPAAPGRDRPISALILCAGRCEGRRAATVAVNRSRTWRNSPGGRNPYSKRSGSTEDTGRRSGPGQTKRFISLTMIHDRSSSRPSRRLTADGISTASSGCCGGLCVTGTTATTVFPPSSRIESTTAHGRSFRPSSCPSCASLLHR